MFILVINFLLLTYTRSLLINKCRYYLQLIMLFLSVFNSNFLWIHRLFFQCILFHFQMHFSFDFLFLIAWIEQIIFKHFSFLPCKFSNGLQNFLWFLFTWRERLFYIYQIYNFQKFSHSELCPQSNSCWSCKTLLDTGYSYDLKNNITKVDQRINI